MNLVRGFDVWSGSGSIDWQTAAARGFRFVIVKCGNENDAPDTSFAVNAKGAHDAGLYVGTYHVGIALHPDPAHPGREPEAQAEAHFKQCGGLGSGGGEIPPALDFEYPIPGSQQWLQHGLSASFVSDWGLAYLERYKTLGGVTPLVYSFPAFISGAGISTQPKYANYPLWLAQYPEKIKHVYPTDTSWLNVPKPWTEARFVQFSGGGVPILSTKGTVLVDGDVFLGSEDDLKEFCSK